MILQTVAVIISLNILGDNVIQCKKQQLTLSDSYLPVAMQVIAHLTDQMAFEVKDDPSTKPTTRPTNKPSYGTNKPTYATNKPTYMTNKPTYTTNKPSSLNDWPTYATSKPTYVTNKPGSSTWGSTQNGWWMTYTTTQRTVETTAFHKPGLYAPLPPKAGDRIISKDHYILLPIDYNSQYTIIEPANKMPTEVPFLSPETLSEVGPIIEPKPQNEPLLPLSDHLPISRTDDGILIDDEEINDENLQYLSPNVKEMLKLANDPKEERLIDIWGDDSNRKAFIDQAQSKGKLSSTNLRLLLLYDLLSREAKRQKLSDYSGFSPELMKELVESASGGARMQLSHALSKMVDRKDSEHDYANNRAKEMVAELARDESTMSAEIRYLHPLIYRL